ncbi:TPA: hypothetical protein L1N13_004203 [Escherichia coli]|nr:hypothetical protein [Escherichia coli]
MTKFWVSLISAIVAFSYYLILWLQPSMLSEQASIFGVLVAFFGLHISLKRFINRHTLHVFLLAVSAGLFTFYRSFADGSVFLFILIGLHGVAALLVLMTIPVGSECT